MCLILTSSVFHIFMFSSLKIFECLLVPGSKSMLLLNSTGFILSKFSLRSPEIQVGELDFSLLIGTSFSMTLDPNWLTFILRDHLDFLSTICKKHFILELPNFRLRLEASWTSRTLMAVFVLFFVLNTWSTMAHSHGLKFC